MMRNAADAVRLLSRSTPSNATAAAAVVVVEEEEEVVEVVESTAVDVGEEVVEGAAAVIVATAAPVSFGRTRSRINIGPNSDANDCRTQQHKR